MFLENVVLLPFARRTPLGLRSYLAFDTKDAYVS